MKEFNTQLFKTSKYYFDKVQLWVCIIVFPLLFYLLFGGTKVNKESLILKTGNLFLLFATITLLLVILILALIRISTEAGTKGDLLLTEENIIINRRDQYKLKALQTLEIKIDATKYKGVKQREVLEGKGNNWLIFNSSGKLYKFEFEIESKERELELYILIDEWRSKSIDIKVSSSDPTRWHKLLL